MMATSTVTVHCGGKLHRISLSTRGRVKFRNHSLSGLWMRIMVKTEPLPRCAEILTAVAARHDETPQLRFSFSRSGRQRGWGSDPYKWVSGLTPEERRAVRDGRLVLITQGVSTHGGHPPYRMVIWRNGRYLPRVPGNDVLPVELGEAVLKLLHVTD